MCDLNTHARFELNTDALHKCIGKTMLYIGARDIARMHAEGVITMGDYVEAIHAGYRDKGEGGVQVIPRTNLRAEENRPGTRPRSLKVAGGLARSLDVMGTVAYSAGCGGGGIDLWIQQESLNQPFVVENKPGAAGQIGAEAGAKAPPDGYTLLVAPNDVMTVTPNLHPNVPYDPGNDVGSAD